MENLFEAREDYVLIRIVDIGKSKGGVIIPQASIQGKEFVVESVGPNVRDLHRGDKVLMLGSKNVSYFELPNDSDLIIMKQEYVCLRINTDLIKEDADGSNNQGQNQDGDHSVDG